MFKIIFFWAQQNLGSTALSSPRGPGPEPRTRDTQRRGFTAAHIPYWLLWLSGQHVWVRFNYFV